MSEQENAVSTSEAASEGIRARRAFMPKHFIPNADWINKNVVAHGKGTKVTLGRLYGIASKCDVKHNTLPDGSASSSVVLFGAFEAEDYLTGELSSMTSAYLPAAYSERVEAVFASGMRTVENKDGGPPQQYQTINAVEIDCDIGLEATGKTIPYEWVVTAFREGEELAVLKRLRNSRDRPTTAPTIGATVKAPALAAPDPVNEGDAVTDGDPNRSDPQPEPAKASKAVK